MTTLVDLVKPKNRSWAISFDCLAILAGSLFLGVSAQLALPLWFTPVPLSLFPLAVLLVGATLGAKRGALAVLTFLAEGALGLPMFAGFSGGIAVLMGPTGGYLVGSVLAAFAVGYLLQRGWINKYGLTTLALFTGSIIILGMGALWLSHFVGMQKALALGVYPFILGDVLKVGAAATLLPTCWKFAR